MLIIIIIIIIIIRTFIERHVCLQKAAEAIMFRCFDIACAKAPKIANFTYLMPLQGMTPVNLNGLYIIEINSVRVIILLPTIWVYLHLILRSEL